MQNHAALVIQELFGEGLVFMNNAGGWSIKKNVFKQFHELTGETAECVRGELARRPRDS
jgi:hypothetical protein